MRIGLCGAGSTGKTTIAKTIAKRFDLPFLPSVARQVMVEEWGLENEMAFTRLPVEEQDQCQDTLFIRRYQLEKQAEHFVGDRTVLDHAAYRLMHCATRMTDATVGDMMSKTLEAMARLSLVFFFPASNLLKSDDAFRNGTGGMRSAIDAILAGLLSRHGIKHIIMPAGSELERTAFVDRHVYTWRRAHGDVS